MPNLIVIAAFDQNEDGELVAAFAPAEQQSEDRAIRLAEIAVAEAFRRDRLVTRGEPRYWRVWPADNPFPEWPSSGNGMAH